MARKQNVTFADIAKYTNFSKTTISRYFNNPDSLTEKNQKIIADALEKLNYQENKVARILASGQTEFVGVIIPNLFLHYYSEMLDRILSTYETFGYKFLVFLSNGDADTERQYIQELLAYKIEGLIILSHAIPSMELANLHIPIVAIEREDAHISSINTDNYMGAIQATSLLYRHNCEVLFHINNPTAKSIPAYGRIEGFEDFCREAEKIHSLCRTYHVPLIINDNVEVAKAVDAEGVHLGQDDMSIAKARDILGNEKIIGATARTKEQAVKAEKEGADYVGSGAVFGTSTKSDAVKMSFDTLMEICKSVKIPVTAIGGITKENVLQLKGTGVSGVAVVSGIFAEKDIYNSTLELRKKIEEVVNGK